MAIKQTILSNVTRAVNNNNQTPQEAKQQKLLTSVNLHLLTLVKLNKKSIREDRQKTTTKLFQRMHFQLDKIRKNTKEANKKGFGVLKLMLFIIAGSIVKAVKGLVNIVRLFGKGVKKFSNTLFLWGKNFGKAFKQTRVGKFLIKLQTSFMTFFEGLKKGFKTSIFARVGIFLKRFANFGKIFNAFGKMFTMVAKLGVYLKPVLRTLGKVLWPITLLITAFDAVKGLVKAAEWFGKKEGEVVTLGEKVSAVIGSVLSGLTFGLLGSGKQFATNLHKMFTKPKEFFTKDAPRILKKMGSNILSMFGKIGSFLFGGIKKLAKSIISIDWVGIIKSIGNVIVMGLEKGISLLKTYVPIIVSKIVDVFKNIDWVKLGQTVFNILSTVVTNISKIAWTIVKNVPSILGTIFKSLFPLITNVLTGMGEMLYGIVSNALSSIWDGIKNLFSTEIITGITDIFTFTTDMATSVIDQIAIWGSGVLTSIWDGIKSVFKSNKESEEPNLITNTMDALTGLKDRVIGGVKAFVMDIVDGIGSVLNLLKIGSKKIITYVKDLLSGDVGTEEIKPKTSQAKINEIENVTTESGLVLSEKSTETEKTKIFMDFMIGIFPDVMAKKIAVAINTSQRSSTNVPRVKIM